MKKSRPIPFDFKKEVSIPFRRCDHEDCDDAGLYPAPKNPRQLRNYYWFCLEHVKEYNKAWDYYRDMSPEEIMESRVSDTTWNRPSWPLGNRRSFFENATFYDGIDDSFTKTITPPSVPKEVHKAMGVLELDFPLTEETVKIKYKKLAKQHHPDLHPGDKETEERLKKINQAYQVLKTFMKH